MYISFTLIFFLSSGSISAVFGQHSQNINGEKQDTIIYKRLYYLQQPDIINDKFIADVNKGDPNFTYKNYVEFLLKISDTSKYIIVPLDKYNETINPNKIIIGLRHDVDLDLNIAYNLSTVENNFGVRSNYYILHTASYYLANPNNMAVHNSSIIPTLKIMQNDYHHEIGWHNDLVTLQLVYKIDPVIFLHQELDWLRGEGLKIKGTASHGSSYCYVYNYLNFYFFEECKNPIIGQFINNDSALVGDQWVKIKHGRLNEFGLDYEAYFLNNNKYYSDASIINGIRWNINMLDLNTLLPGDRVIILMHPIYYSPVGSSLSEITSFSLTGQIRSEINSNDATVYVEMPEWVERESLNAIFSISPNARAMLGSKELFSGLNSIDFTNPVNIKVVAEDGLSFKNWLVKVISSDCSLLLSVNKILIGPQIDSSASFQITSNISWSITSSEDWLTSNTENGNGNGTITLIAQANPTTSSRLAEIKVSGDGIVDQIITVIQDAGIVGIDVISNSLISIYPNPAHTILFVKGIDQNSMISIFDLRGRMLINHQIVDNMIDISSLANGIYIIKIRDKGIITTIRFIKK